jgi:hypothetical protein
VRPYAPNKDPQPYGLLQGSARLLERIWQPGAQYSQTARAWGLDSRELRRSVEGWQPSAADFLATYVRTRPQRAPERVASFDAIRFVDSDELPPIDNGPTAYEIARVDAQEGLTILESIETWARIQPLRTIGPPLDFAYELLPDGAGDLAPLDISLRTLGTPCPFPLLHPQTQGQTRPGPFSIEWVLVYDRSDPNSMPADLLGPAPWSQVPEAMGTPPYWPFRWNDQRYPWCSSPPNRQKWSCGLPGVIRLFAKVTTSAIIGPPGPPGESPAWRFKIAGRLRGFHQPPGPSGAAFRNLTTRH